MLTGSGTRDGFCLAIRSGMSFPQASGFVELDKRLQQKLKLQFFCRWEACQCSLNCPKRLQADKRRLSVNV